MIPRGGRIPILPRLGIPVGFLSVKEVTGVRSRGRTGILPPRRVD
jgi:hypothetical protein